MKSHPTGDTRGICSLHLLHRQSLLEYPILRTRQSFSCNFLPNKNGSFCVGKKLVVFFHLSQGDSYLNLEADVAS